MHYVDPTSCTVNTVRWYFVRVFGLACGLSDLYTFSTHSPHILHTFFTHISHLTVIYSEYQSLDSVRGELTGQQRQPENSGQRAQNKSKYCTKQAGIIKYC